MMVRSLFLADEFEARRQALRGLCDLAAIICVTTDRDPELPDSKQCPRLGQRDLEID